ncbi:tRNA-binding protein [Dongia mobilis]|uniref:tRNA-binding protein n=1 Tax=Dongia mobilis TaxID=578943 RepID=A0A4R6WS32_9PROT|nr:tRNA-binding protein [Dongia mobilis]TDQ82387.1 tRNA-binding protein [Dongia mobilis]
MTSQPEPIAAEISYDDFRKVDIRVGTIVAAEPYPEARRPAYKLTVDFGPEIGMKRSSAQITKRYALDELPGRQVAAVVNFPKKQIGKFMSEVLVLGFPDAEGEVVLVAPSLDVPNGGRLY